MLFTDIRAAVFALTKSEAIQDLVDAAIKREWYLMTRNRRIDDFIQKRTTGTLTTTATDGIVTFTTWGHLMAIKEVRFSSGGKEWTLADEDGRIQPAAVFGRPRAYKMIGSDGTTSNGDKIYVEPFATVANPDACYITWWRVPDPLIASPSAGFITDTNVATHMLDTELIDRTCANIWIYYNKNQQAAALLSKYQQASPQAQAQAA